MSDKFIKALKELGVAVRGADDFTIEALFTVQDEATRLMKTLTRYERVVVAAQQVYDAVDIKGDRGCPHGNSAAYPVHGWFCDDCFFQLKEALNDIGE